MCHLYISESRSHSVLYHSFLEAWIAAQPENATPDGRKVFNCPNCRTEIAIPLNGLPVYRMAEEMREKSKKLQEAIEEEYADPNELRAPPENRQVQNQPTGRQY